ncbi:MAG TPA: tetratricopeptide repeat protein [Bryobacteraceae bacterium]|nr:tetratricopeptide repeat protein [Bryobacteraceae bacterium]
MKLLSLLIAVSVAGAGTGALEQARDKQDRATLERMVNAAASTAKAKPKDADAQYQAALAHSYLAEVAIEVHDKGRAFSVAESGIEAAEHAVELRPNSAEYNRILGTLCGQAISSAGLAGLRHGRCALESIDKAVELDPKSSDVRLSHGVGMYYLPAAFGGGVDQAIADFRKAIALNPTSAEAWLWLGIALRKTNQPTEARKAIEKSLQLNPARVWASQQLAKTPGK